MPLHRRADHADDAEAGCQLLDSFALFVQLCLAMIAFSTLFIKRQREKPRRPVRIWAFDVGKQLIGGVVIHSLNLLASYLFGADLEGGGRSNPCVWYFLNILVDTTLGVGILWAILSAVQHGARLLRLPNFQSGVYGEPPFRKQLKRWMRQLAVYCAALVIMKILVLLIFRLCPWLENVGRWVLGWTLGNYRLQVVFVMLIFPLVMNTVQFWIVDTIVKHKGSAQQIWLSPDDDPDYSDNILVDAYDDDDDDDDNHEEAPGTFHGSWPMLNEDEGHHFNAHGTPSHELDPWKDDTEDEDHP